MENNRDDFIIAIRSALLKKNTQQRFSILSLILFSIIFLILGSYNFKIIDFTKSIIKDVVYTSSFMTSIPENLIKKSYNNVDDHFNHYNDYQEMKDRLQKLKSKDLSKKIITLENIKLKKLIEDYFIKETETYAKVLIDKQSPFLKSIILNKGSKNNIKIGMIVLDDIYLIGKVVEVNHLTSRVLLISDINSKVPVSIEPVDVQAIMSGTGEENGILQYIQGEDLKNKDSKDLLVITSGSGGVFKSGIPIGTISNLDTLNNRDVKVSFYKNFSQLKYVKITSHIEENSNLDLSNKDNFEIKDRELEIISSQKESFKVLQKQKIIDDEIRDKFEKENTTLKEEIIKTEKKLEKANKLLGGIKIKNKEIEFLELNLLYGHKCRKTFYNKLFKVGSFEYKACVLNKGPKIKKNNE